MRLWPAFLAISVQPGLVRVEQKSRQLAPSLSGRVGTAWRRRDCKQNSQDIGVRKLAHFASPFGMRFSHSRFPTTNPRTAAFSGAYPRRGELPHMGASRACLAFTLCLRNAMDNLARTNSTVSKGKLMAALPAHMSLPFGSHSGKMSYAD